MTSAFLARVRAVADRIEGAPIGPGAWTAGFLAIVSVRHLLELLSGRLPLYSPTALFVHYPLAYLAPALTFSILLALLARVPVRRVARLMLAAAMLLLLPPLVDLALPLAASVPGLPSPAAQAIDQLASGPRAIGYLYGQTLGETLATFLDPRRVFEGTTAGVRIEALVACLMGAFYVLLRGARAWRVLATLPALLVAAILFFTLPTRFFEVARLASPALTIEALYGGRGILPGPGSLHDGISTIYLAALVLLLLLLVALLDGGAAGLRRGPGALAWSDGVLAGAVAAAGVAAGRMTRLGLDAGLEASAYDQLASAATVAAATLVVASLRARRASEPAALAGAAIGLCLALGAGYAALFGTLALAGTAWLCERVLAAVAPGSPARALGSALLGLAALAQGYVSLAGDDGLTFVGSELLGAGLLAGLGAGLAADRTLGSRPLGAALAAAGSVLAVVAWPLLLAPPPQTTAVVALFFGGAALAACLGLPVEARRLLGGTVGLLGLAAAGLSLATRPVQADLVQTVVSRPAYHLDRGNELLEADLFQDAERSFRLASALAPDDAEPWARLGLVEIARSSRVTGARGLPPVRAIAGAGEALAEESKRRLSAAADAFREAVQRDPAHPSAAYNLGAALLSLGECAGAVESFDGALATRPGHAGALFQRAEALECLGRTEDALEAYRRYVALTAADPGQAAVRRTAEDKIRFLSVGRPQP